MFSFIMQITMKSTNNKKLKSWEKLWEYSKKSWIITKTLVALSTVFILWQQPAKADPIINPAYSFLEINIFNDILWDNENIKDLNTKEVIKKNKVNTFRI